MKTWDECLDEAAKQEGYYNWTEFTDTLDSAIDVRLQNACHVASGLYAEYAIKADRERIDSECFYRGDECMCVDMNKFDQLTIPFLK